VPLLALLATVRLVLGCSTAGERVAILCELHRERYVRAAFSIRKLDRSAHTGYDRHLIWLELVVHPTSSLVFENDPARPT
jgi:hypothetical protein